MEKIFFTGCLNCRQKIVVTPLMTCASMVTKILNIVVKLLIFILNLAILVLLISITDFNFIFMSGIKLSQIL